MQKTSLLLSGKIWQSKVGNLLRINGGLHRMQFPQKLKNNPVAERCLVVAGLVTN